MKLAATTSFLIVFLVATPACDAGSNRSGAKSSSTTSAKATVTSAAPAQTSAPTSSRPSQLEPGIVVASYADEWAPTIGSIDPVSGHYTQFATFRTRPAPFPENIAATAFSPDFLRAATSRKIGDVYHAGWIDINSKFTDVNADSPAPGPFDDPKLMTFDPIGFDGAGNFYYTKPLPGGDATIKVPAGQTSGGEPVELPFGGSAWQYTRDGNGVIHLGINCVSSEQNPWISPTEYVTTTENQIFKRSVADSQHGCESGTPLLPTTNTSKIGEAVPSPNGQEVAFRRNGSELWIVSSSGGGSPRQVNVTGIDMSNRSIALIDWK